MRFIADAMLGKLARWLRLMGYSVLYDVDLDDSKIIEISGGRTVLTRDQKLYSKLRKDGHKAILIKDTDIKGQLTQLQKDGIKLRVAPLKARCPLCNGKIKKIKRDKIKVNVPEDATEFFVCSRCQNIYWEGSHWKNIKDTIKDVESRGKDVQNPK